MAKTIVEGLRDMREDLLRQLVLADEKEKTELIIKIMEMEELITNEEKTTVTA